MPTLSGSSWRRSYPLTSTLNHTQSGDFDFKILVTLGTPEDRALRGGMACGLRGRRQVRVVVLMHVKVNSKVMVTVIRI